MGVLDWLNDAIGGSASTEMSQSPGMVAGLPQPTPPSAPAAPPTPPPAPPITASPPIAPPAGMDGSGSPLPPPQVAPAPPGGPQGGSPPPPPPMPPPQAVAPPNAAPTQGALPPAPPPAMQQAIPSAAGGQSGFLGRALGLDPNQERTLSGSLAEGLKSVGTNWNKPAMAAAAGSAGSAIEGGNTAQDKTYDQKIKYLTAAIAAQQAGDKAEYNKNYAAYLTGKLKNDTDAAAAKDGSAGKKGAWNKPDSQKFIDAQHALANDPDIKASQKLLEQTARTGEPADVAKAQAAHTALVQQKQAMYLAGVGLNPQKVQQQAQNPPGTQGNPHIVTSKEDFDTYVKPGDAFVNPKDGKVYIRKGGGQASDSAAAAAGAAAPATPSAPEAPGAEPGTKTEDDE